MIPEGFKEVVRLDMLGNKHKLIDKLNAAAMILVIACGAIGLVLNYVLRMLRMPGGMYFVYSLGGAALCIAYIYLHELAHALAIIMIKRKKPEIKFGKFVASCGAPSVTFSKPQYVFAASFPLVFYCAALIPLCVLLPAEFFPLPFLPLCYNVFGSMGDVYMMRVMTRSKKGCVIVDNGTEVIAYAPIEPQP
ncbi:MAG: DUF3267 domain-containing protein [Clostridiales bacterium]|nr:DUF3267 domain-containing protein [Clostridiales bacterium]